MPHEPAQKSVEERLRACEARLEAIVQNTPNVAIQGFDMDGRVAYWNNASERMYGWSAAEAAGKTLDQLIFTPAQEEAYLQLLHQIAATGKAVGPLEFQFRRRNGEQGWCLSTVFQIPSEPGHPDFICMDVDITARKAAEIALRASEELFSKAFHTSPNATTITRKSDGIILQANEALGRKYGVACADLIGLTTFEAGIWRDKEERDDLLRRLDASGSLRNHPKKSVLPSGEITMGLLSIETLVINGEECMLSISSDITQLLQTERALRESEERYRNFIALSAEGIARIDFDTPISVSLPVGEQVRAIIETGFCAECNEAFARMRGLPGARDGQGRRVKELMKTTETANLVNLAGFVEEGYQAGDAITLGRDVLGNDAYFLNNAVGVVTDGFLMHIWTVQRDITKRVHAERALLASEERFELAVRGSNDGLWDWNVRTNETYYSPRFRELLGYSPTEEFPPVSETFFAHVHPEDRDRIHTAVEEHLKNRKPYDVEYRLILRSGECRWFRARGQAVWNADGEAVRMAGSITDIHDHTLAEESLRRAQAEALAASKEFTQRLISAQEQERKRLANELHDSLGQNLSLIKNRAYLASQPTAAENVGAHLQAITEVVTTAIDEVRNLARNLRPLHIDQFGLTDALENLMEQTSQSASLRVERRLENVDDLFHGEEATNIYRIIQEALNNVLRHAHAGRVTVTLERDVHCARIRIEDDGRGFDAAAVSEARRTRTGIGLTSIDERVRMLGGILKVHSVPGQGTRIEIEIPLSQSGSAGAAA